MPTIVDLYDEHSAVVYRFCLKKLDFDQPAADDALQETFLRACENLDQLDDLRSPRAWLLKIAENVVIDMQRRRRKRPDLLVAEAPEPHTPEEDVGAATARELLIEALPALPEPQQKVLAAVLRAGGPHQHQARRAVELGVPQATADQAVHRLAHRDGGYLHDALVTLHFWRIRGGECGEMRQVLAGFDALDPLLRKRAMRHVDSCRSGLCREEQRRAPHALRILTALPVFGAPPYLRERILRLAAGTHPAASDGHASHSRGAPGHPSPSMRPGPGDGRRPAHPGGLRGRRLPTATGVLAGAAVIVVAVVAGHAMSSKPAESTRLASPNGYSTATGPDGTASPRTGTPDPTGTTPGDGPTQTTPGTAPPTTPNTHSTRQPPGGDPSPHPSGRSQPPDPLAALEPVEITSPKAAPACIVQPALAPARPAAGRPQVVPAALPAQPTGCPRPPQDCVERQPCPVTLSIAVPGGFDTGLLDDALTWTLSPFEAPGAPILTATGQDAVVDVGPGLTYTVTATLSEASGRVKDDQIVFQTNLIPG